MSSCKSTVFKEDKILFCYFKNSIRQILKIHLFQSTNVIKKYSRKNDFKYEALVLFWFFFRTSFKREVGSVLFLRKLFGGKVQQLVLFTNFNKMDKAYIHDKNNPVLELEQSLEATLLRRFMQVSRSDIIWQENLFFLSRSARTRSKCCLCQSDIKIGRYITWQRGTIFEKIPERPNIGVEFCLGSHLDFHRRVISRIFL